PPALLSLPLAQLTESILVEEGEDSEEETEELGDDEDTSTLSPLLLLVHFTSVWKAVAAGGKEVLPGTKSAVFDTDNLFLFQLEAWRDQTLLNLQPQKFSISQLQAIASYEKARQADCCPQEICTSSNLCQAIDLIKEWYKR